ncbi:MAG: hypothetical protein IJ731_01210 [Eubacterium sp.]|nr:hypothetical protein [Eubacterium sp.]
MYPDKKIDFGEKISEAKYKYEDKLDEQKKSAVIDWYYKKNGILHYCKFVGKTVLFATEN